MSQETKKPSDRTVPSCAVSIVIHGVFAIALASAVGSAAPEVTSQAVTEISIGAPAEAADTTAVAEEKQVEVAASTSAAATEEKIAKKTENIIKEAKVPTKLPEKVASEEVAEENSVQAEQPELVGVVQKAESVSDETLEAAAESAPEKSGEEVAKEEPKAEETPAEPVAAEVENAEPVAEQPEQAKEEAVPATAAASATAEPAKAEAAAEQPAPVKAAEVAAKPEIAEASEEIAANSEKNKLTQTLPEPGSKAVDPAKEAAPLAAERVPAAATAEASAAAAAAPLVRDVAELRQLPGNRPPSYPENSRLRRESGNVVLEYYVTSNGEVTNMKVLQSSGFRDLDVEAVDAVSQYRFYPGQEGVAQHTVQFNLKGQVRQLPSRLRTMGNSSGR